MSSSLHAIKLKGEIKLAEEKRVIDRNRNLLVLILHYLSNSKYLEAANSLQNEAGILLSKFTVADNIDLEYILQVLRIHIHVHVDCRRVLSHCSFSSSSLCFQF